MAGVAADRVEDDLARHAAARGLRRLREVALEVGHALDEGEPRRIGRVFRIGDGVARSQQRGVAVRRVLGADERVGDT
ncbi:MAG: hypothetical protein ACK56F_18145, partial [bacterium]